MASNPQHDIPSDSNLKPPEQKLTRSGSLICSISVATAAAFLLCCSPWVRSGIISNTRSSKRLQEVLLFDIDTGDTGEGANENVINLVQHGRSIRRLALVRPFGTRMASILPRTFDSWSDFSPCDLSGRLSDLEIKQLRGQRVDALEVDVFLSFSQRLEDHPEAAENAEKVLRLFGKDGGDGTDRAPWARCFHDAHVFSVGIPPEEDIYQPNEAHRNPLWVNGPNRQFVSSLRSVLGEEFGQYDAVFIMEGDCVPIKDLWLENLLDEAEEAAPFAILGSKYDGDSWSKFRSSLPLSLQHHINGNALYNISHPLLHRLLEQIDTEAGTPYNAVPYDYRISQILVEGMLGVKPEVPPSIVEQYIREGHQMEDNTEKFRRWWEAYGDHGGGDMGAIRETSAIANYAGTNLLPRHVENEVASILHGAKYYLPWDEKTHNITLVITDWHHELSLNLLSGIDSSSHPFSNVIIMTPPDLSSVSYRHLATFKASIPTSVRSRFTSDFMDLCNAPVETDWFMITNSYYALADYVDLLFSDEDGEIKPVIPYIPVNGRHCFANAACKEANRLARQLDSKSSMIIEDFDMIFNTQAKGEFCDVWTKQFGHNGERLYGPKSPAGAQDVGYRGPSATSYAAYLSGRGRLRELYKFTDRTFYGSRDNFVREFTEEEEYAAADGEAVLSNRLLSSPGRTGLGLSIVGGIEVERKLQKAKWTPQATLLAQNDPVMELRYLQLSAPTGIQTAAPTTEATLEPTNGTPEPTIEGTPEPTGEDDRTPEPTTEGTPEPTVEGVGTSEPTTEGTPEPTVDGTLDPTTEGTPPEPTTIGTVEPTYEGTQEPTAEDVGTSEPTTEGTPEPTADGTLDPTTEGMPGPPTLSPEERPENSFSGVPTLSPEDVSETNMPTTSPFMQPSLLPIDRQPTHLPTSIPTVFPLNPMTFSPTRTPTTSPSMPPVMPPAEIFFSCRDWCSNIGMSWSNKCSWKTLCGGCPECSSLGTPIPQTNTPTISPEEVLLSDPFGVQTLSPETNIPTHFPYKPPTISPTEMPTKSAIIPPVMTPVEQFFTCRSWCAISNIQWPKKCTWKNSCGGCPECSSTYLAVTKVVGSGRGRKKGRKKNPNRRI